MTRRIARPRFRATPHTATWQRTTSHIPNAPPPPFTLGTSAHAARQTQCLRPAPTKPKHTLDAPPSTQASPTRNFWTVSQAESARNATQRRRFPRSAEPTANIPRRKPHRSPGLMAKSAPVSCETAQNLRGRARGQGRGSRKRRRGRNPKHRGGATAGEAAAADEHAGMLRMHHESSRESARGKRQQSPVPAPTKSNSHPPHQPAKKSPISTKNWPVEL